MTFNIKGFYFQEILMYDYKKFDPEECEFFEIASQDELGDGERLFIEVSDIQIVLFKITGEYFAIGDVCSHDDGPLGDGKVEEFSVTCPRHGAKFDVRTGKVLSLPAIVDIPAYPTRIVNNRIEIGLPKNEDK
jgi:3-phenylpropionate/trans-cinnamate dioxygenase ferredoxin subunit